MKVDKPFIIRLKNILSMIFNICLTDVPLGLIGYLLGLNSSYAQIKTAEKEKNKIKAELIYADDFNLLDTLKWKSEIEDLPGSSVYVRNNRLYLNTKGGVTVWLNKLLKGNVQIEFTRRVIVAGGANDRLSDLNQFWMANDPAAKVPFKRNGRFESYDSLQLYYAGIGGNTNTTTRFRKYKGNGERELLKEYLDKNYLLKPNIEYKIKIVVKNNTIAFWVDDVCYFSYTDSNAFREGYFGFRSTYSHQEIDNFRVYQLK